MNLQQRFALLEQMHHLISQESTGSPRKFAEKLHITERNLYRELDFLKALDAPIAYSRKYLTYYYTTPVDVSLAWRYIHKKPDTV